MSGDAGVGQGDEGAWETATGWIPSGRSTHRTGERKLLLRVGGDPGEDGLQRICNSENTGNHRSLPAKAASGGLGTVQSALCSGEFWHHLQELAVREKSKVEKRASSSLPFT